MMSWGSRRECARWQPRPGEFDGGEDSQKDDPGLQGEGRLCRNASALQAPRASDLHCWGGWIRRLGPGIGHPTLFASAKTVGEWSLRVFRSWGSQRAKRAGDCERHPRWPSWVLYLPNSGLRGMGERAAAVRGPEIASGADQDGQIDERYVAGSPAVLSASTVAGVRGRPTKEAARRHARRPKAALEFVEKVFTSARLGLGLGPGSASPPY